MQVRAENPGFEDELPQYIDFIFPQHAETFRYVTNILALKMTFFPVEFWGIKIWQPEDQPLGCIGWQVPYCRWMHEKTASLGSDDNYSV